jgi:hypothetical protein
VIACEENMMLFISSDRKIQKLYQGGELSAASGMGLPPARRPGHCGADMELTMQSSAAAGDFLSPILGGPVRDLHLVWQCRCGFRLDPRSDPRNKVWAAAAAVEGCQWEMDHAVLQLDMALRAASAMGVADELLAKWAQLSPREIKRILDQNA